MKKKNDIKSYGSQENLSIHGCQTSVRVHLPHTRTTRSFCHTRSGCLFMRVTRGVRYCAFECHFKFYWFLGSVGAYQSSSQPNIPIDCSTSCYIRVLFLGIPLRMHLPPRIRALRPSPALWYSTPQPPPPCVSPLRGRDHTSLCAHPLIVCNFSQHVFPPPSPLPTSPAIGVLSKPLNS